MVAGVASKVASNTLGQTLKRVGRIYLHTSFGTGVDTFAKSLDKSIFGARTGKWHTDFFKRYKNGDWKNFGKHFKTAVKATEADEELWRTLNGGSYTKSLWEHTKGLWEEPINAFRNAQKLGKSGLGAGFKQLRKSAFKRIPLIGGALMFLSSFGDIKAAFKEGGLVNGAWETVKSAAGIGIDMAGFAIGQALIPIPFVGGIIGSMVIGGLGRKILKPWREKHPEAQANEALNNSTNNTSVDWNNVQPGQQYDYIGWDPVQSQLTPEQLMQLNNMYRRVSRFDAIG